MDETALTLKQAADRLGLSYQAVFARRYELGFRLPGSRVWRVWPSRLAEISQPRYNVTRLALRSDTGVTTQCRSTNAMAPGTSILPFQATRELDALLARRTKRPRKSSTTG